jgi:hypothetical protein
MNEKNNEALSTPLEVMCSVFFAIVFGAFAVQAVDYNNIILTGVFSVLCYWSCWVFVREIR